MVSRPALAGAEVPLPKAPHETGAAAGLAGNSFLTIATPCNAKPRLPKSRCWAEGLEVLGGSGLEDFFRRLQKKGLMALAMMSASQEPQQGPESAARSQVLHLASGMTNALGKRVEISTIPLRSFPAQWPTVIGRWAPTPLRFPGNGTRDALQLDLGNNGLEASKPANSQIFTPTGVKTSCQDAI